MKAYSMDLRERVLADCDAGMQTRSVATKYRVSESWIRRLKQRRRDHGELAPRPRRRMPEPRWLPYTERLHALVRQQPDATLVELRQRLDIDLSIATLARALRALHLTFKKKSCGPRSKSGRMFSSGAAPGRRR